MATKPTQMRLTEQDKEDLDYIARYKGLSDRTATVRWMTKYCLKKIAAARLNKISKKSSVLT